MSRTGAAEFLDGLVRADVRHLFTLPGTQTLPLLRLIAEQSEVEPVFVRSEQAAAFGAVGYARATGRPAACLSIPGPGATNMVSGVAAAAADAIPLIGITPQLDEHLRHRNAVHDCDLAALFAPLVKAQLIIDSVESIRSTLVAAAALAVEAPMGPVHVQYPQSLLNATTAKIVPQFTPTRRPRSLGMADLDLIATSLTKARRPVIYAGNAVLMRNAEQRVVILAERFHAAVFTDEDARGVIAEDHPLALGCASHDRAVAGLERADFCLAIGTGMSEWSTKSWTIRIPEQLIHISEAGAYSRQYPVLAGFTAPVDEALNEILAHTTATHPIDPAVGRSPSGPPSSLRPPVRCDNPDSPLHPGDVADALASVLTPQTVITLDGSSCAMWMAERFPVRRPRTFLQSEVFREIGSALMMGIGAAVAQPDPVLIIQGDGGFLFQLGELSTVAQAQLRLVVVVFEDGYYTADRLFQEHVYGGRLSDSAVLNPDYVAVAHSFGLAGVRVRNTRELQDAVRAAYGAATATIIAVPTVATAAPARLRERFVEWRRRLGRPDAGQTDPTAEVG